MRAAAFQQPAYAPSRPAAALHRPASSFHSNLADVFAAAVAAAYSGFVAARNARRRLDHGCIIDYDANNSFLVSMHGVCIRADFP
jgi:hypothetical protein